MDNCSVNPKNTKIIAGRHPITTPMEQYPGSVGQVANPFAVEDGDMSLYLISPGLVVTRQGRRFYLTG
jgi:hypothetical protein